MARCDRWVDPQGQFGQTIREIRSKEQSMSDQSSSASDPIGRSKVNCVPIV
jgi:hypothetical protein